MARTAAASSPISRSSAYRLPVTMNSDPNTVHSTNQLDITTPAATAPPAARSTKPEATATMSITATCFNHAL